jgi:hypothetical protein
LEVDLHAYLLLIAKLYQMGIKLDFFFLITSHSASPTERKDVINPFHFLRLPNIGMKPTHSLRTRS